MSKAVRCLLAVAAVAVIGGCGGPPEPKTTPRLEQSTFRVGFATLTRRDIELARAAVLAVEELNAQGGVAGAVRIELVQPDEAGAPADVARRLIQRGVQALIVSCEPEAVAAMADVAQRTQVLALAPCNDDPRMPSRFPLLWPVSLSANAEAAALADVALTREVASVQVEGASPFARYFRVAAKDRDIRVTAGPGEVLVSALDAGLTLALPRGATPLLGSHLLDSEAFAQSAGAEGATFTTFGFPAPGSAAAEFYRAFEQRYGSRPSGSAVALGYDAIRVLARAMEEGGKADAATIGDALSRGLSVQGALGEIVYPGAGERNPEAAVAVVEVRNGRLELVEKSLPEDIPPP